MRYKEIKLHPKSNFLATSRNHLQILPHTKTFFPRCKKGAGQMILTLPEATVCSSHVIMRQDKSLCSQDKLRPWEESMLKAAIKTVLPLAAKSLTIQCLRRGDWDQVIHSQRTATGCKPFSIIFLVGQSSNFSVKPFTEIMTIAQFHK